MGLLRWWQKRRELEFVEPQVQETGMDLHERLRVSQNYEPRPQPTLADLGWVGTDEEEEAQPTHREWLVAVLVVEGWSTMEIGERFGLDINLGRKQSPSIEMSLGRLYSKFGLKPKDLEAWVKQHSAPDAVEKVLAEIPGPPWKEY